MNEAGAPFAGDATGLRGGGDCWRVIAGRGCWLGGRCHGFTNVSRAARANGQIPRAGGGLAPSIRTLTRYSECGQPRPRTGQRVRLRNSGLAFRMTGPGHHPSGTAATSHAIDLRCRRPRQHIRLTLLLPESSLWDQLPRQAATMRSSEPEQRSQHGPRRR